MQGRVDIGDTLKFLIGPGALSTWAPTRSGNQPPRQSITKICSILTEPERDIVATLAIFRAIEHNHGLEARRGHPWELGGKYMVKPDHWIRAFGLEGGILPFEEDQINPASYDVTLGNHWICPTRDPEEVEVDSITLFPGEVVLATTREFLKMPRDVVCDLKLKSSLGRLWLNHSLSGWIDPNFQGQVTLELQNLGPYPRVLTTGMRIAQLVFIGMESAPEVAYGERGRGHYQGQSGATRAWSEDFFPRTMEKPRK